VAYQNIFLSVILGFAFTSQIVFSAEEGMSPGADHPAMPSPHSMQMNTPHGTPPAQNKAKFTPPPKSSIYKGKVIDLVKGSGYSYMRVDSGSEKYWVAGTTAEVKKGDIIEHDLNVTMENFTSRSLSRTFDKIIFASNVSVAK